MLLWIQLLVPFPTYFPLTKSQLPFSMSAIAAQNSYVHWKRSSWFFEQEPACIKVQASMSWGKAWDNLFSSNIKDCVCFCMHIESVWRCPGYWTLSCQCPACTQKSLRDYEKKGKPFQTCLAAQCTLLTAATAQIPTLTVNELISKLEALQKCR